MEPARKRKDEYKKYNQHGSTEPIPKRTLFSWKNNICSTPNRGAHSCTLAKQNNPGNRLNEAGSSRMVHGGYAETAATKSQHQKKKLGCNLTLEDTVHSSDSDDSASVSNPAQKITEENPVPQDEDDSYGTDGSDTHISNESQDLENVGDEEPEDLRLAINENKAQNLQNVSNANRDEITAVEFSSDTCAFSTHGYKIETLIRALLVMATIMRHNLTYAAAQDISSLLDTALERPPIGESKYHL